MVNGSSFQSFEGPDAARSSWQAQKRLFFFAPGDSHAQA
jgi:hypothetical protein